MSAPAPEHGPGRGPLAGLRVVEFAGLGPAPLAGQLLADQGANVIVIERAGAKGGVIPPGPTDLNRRGKRSIALDLKSAPGQAAAEALITRADVLIEGFRPGVMERLGFGPARCAELNPGLIYGRMTGWGQDGPRARTAGHDLNYISLTGALAATGTAAMPGVPLNLYGDYGGGTMFLIFGIMSALYERRNSGRGQVVDAAMVDGVPAMMALIHGMRARDEWSDRRADNMLDGGAPYYRCYKCACGGFIAVGAIEPQFFAELVARAGLGDGEGARQNDKSQWPEMHAKYEAVFARRSRDEWTEVFAGSDACVTPVLSFDEAANDAHMVARAVFYTADGIAQAAPAPRFSRSVAPTPSAPVLPGADTSDILRELGLDPDQPDKG